MTQLFSLLKIERSGTKRIFDAVVLDTRLRRSTLQSLLSKLIGSIGKKIYWLNGMFSITRMFQPLSKELPRYLQKNVFCKLK